MARALKTFQSVSMSDSFHSGPFLVVKIAIFIEEYLEESIGQLVGIDEALEESQKYGSDV